MSEVTHIRAAVRLLDGNAKQSEVAELAPQIHRELVAAIDLGSARRDLIGRERAYRVAQHVDVFSQPEIQGRKLLEKVFSGFHGSLSDSFPAAPTARKLAAAI